MEHGREIWLGQLERPLGTVPPYQDGLIDKVEGDEFQACFLYHRLDLRPDNVQLGLLTRHSMDSAGKLCSQSNLHDHVLKHCGQYAGSLQQ